MWQAWVTFKFQLVCLTQLSVSPKHCSDIEKDGPKRKATINSQANMVQIVHLEICRGLPEPSLL
jgi:hypothetical protein